MQGIPTERALFCKAMRRFRRAPRAGQVPLALSTDREKVGTDPWILLTEVADQDELEHGIALDCPHLHWRDVQRTRSGESRTSWRSSKRSRSLANASCSAAFLTEWRSDDTNHPVEGEVHDKLRRVAVG